MTDLNLDRLAELEALATPGPWRHIETAWGESVEVDEQQLFIEQYGVTYAWNGYNAALIAEMRNATPALLARVRELEATVEKVREAVSGHPKCDIYDDDDPITCGWKSAYRSVVKALGDD